MRSRINRARERVTTVSARWPRAKPGRRQQARSRLAALTAWTVAVGLLPMAALVSAPAQAAPVGSGFEVNPADLRFILDQIKIAEHHAATATPANPCGTLLGDGPNQIPDTGNNAEELAWGLRTVDGSCNNLMPGQEHFGATDEVFPRRVPARFRDAEVGDPDGPGPQVARPTSYKQKSGTVVDSEPRVISNLIVDQTKANPAAVAAAGVDPATVQEGESLSIPHVAPDTGLSAPYNMVFTFFGQFFDHGLDLVSKSGGIVFMPLRPDDPLYREGSDTNFMVLTRATNQPGPDGEMGTADDVQEATNTTSPFVDQNQTYTSHPAHQVFVREYAIDADGDPVSTGMLLTGPDGGLATWGSVKQQSADRLGIQLSDTDVLDVPLLATDPYGRFLPGDDGYPQIVVENADGTTGMVEGDPAANGGAGVSVPDNAVRTGHAFLVDIAHHAVPVGDTDPSDGPGQVVPLQPDGDPGTTPDRNPDGSPNRSTYDDEMLGRHFIAGDGRVNENIALTAVHHVFHAEHNRLVGHVKDVLLNEADADLAAEYQLGTDAAGAPVWNGERLFQAAKFVTEMEYQHLVFEEFARRVQPMVNAFGEGNTGYDTSANPAIKAEFAHAVYRFGHSLLTQTVARRNTDGSRNNVSLLQAFLNPPAYNDGGPTPDPDDGAARRTLSPQAAAGSLFRGLSRQVGNEIDEFVTGALRSNLLGLPLDLAAINIARGRDTGTPTLNEARRVFYAESGNSALRPYTSWTDFSFNLKHRESLVNFVAAYGTHTTIEMESTVAGKRQAAARIIANDPADALTPVDSSDFMNGTGMWANAETGINDIDLWVGGLAEKRMVFGGLLGSTFNYVFEQQMEDLQFGDRFYYLSRLAGTNMLTQLEGNSFAELIMRNTDVQGLPADVFSRPDYIFNLGNLGTSGPITDDPWTEDYDESDTEGEPGMHLHRRPDGTLRYTGPAHAVFNGTADADRIWSSEGDDTLRGNDGDDWMEGGDGVDNLIGGLGDDIMEDLFGDDVIKGGPGHDTISSGQGFGGDLNQGGAGKDFIVGGNDMTETFGGPGDDFIFAGDGEDTVFGDNGDDWIEGGKGPFNLLQGDHGQPFQNDPNGGHDVIDGDGGEQDFDAEGGDDIMLLGPGIQRAEGMLGFDWTTHKGDPQPADSDMTFTELTRPSVDALRDRFDMVEALSGWKLDDVLRGDSRLQAEPPPAADGEAEEPEAGVEDEPEEHTLTQAGINRIDGLALILPPGMTSYNTGNILLGGAGNDVLEGRGGDDIVDGDAWLNVQLEAPDPDTLVTTDRQRVNRMGQLRADVLAGRINPGDISIVRRIDTAAPGTSDLDTAVFSDLRANYDCSVDGGPVQVGGCPTAVPGGATITVAHAAGTQADGTDTLRNVERLVFSDTQPPGTPGNVTATAANESATVTWSAPAQGAVEGFRVRVLDASGAQVGPLREVPAEETTLQVGGLTNGEAYRFEVQAWNAAGDGAFSAPSAPVTPAPVAPDAPTLRAPEPGDQQVTLTWAAPADTGGSAITGYRVRVLDATGGVLQRHDVAAEPTRLVVTGLTNGKTYWFDVAAVSDAGTSRRAESRGVTPATVPDAPAIGRASRRDSAAVVRWSAPAGDGGAAVTGYRVRVLDAGGTQVGALRRTHAAASRLRVGGLQNGSAYRFQVAAVNSMGAGRFSALSNRVRPAARPDPPRIRRARWGFRGGRVTARARWAAPADDGGSPIIGYRVAALRVNRAGDVTSRRVSRLRPADSRRFNMRLRRGRYRFEVRAVNEQRRSRWSQESRIVRAR